MTQKQRILDYLEKHESITPMEAFSELGITKLATRIGEITQTGIRIDKIPSSGLNRFGETVRFMRYKKAV